MQLKSLKINARDPGGWGSEDLFFADDMTQLFGPNSCGKTPLIQSIAFALGYPVSFRDDIISHCESVELVLATEDGDIELLRQVENRFDVRVSVEGEGTDFYYLEKDLSKNLFQIFNLSTTTLTSVSNEPVEPYLATFLPLFYLDQDHGYTKFYHPSAKFIKDQYGEMVRLAFGLPAKHSFDRQKLKIAKTKRLSLLDRLIVDVADGIEELRKEFNVVPRRSDQITLDLEQNKSALKSLRDSRSVGSDAYRALEQLIHERKNKLADISREERELQSRVSGFEKIQGEIEVEIRTLSLNSEARRLFISFEEVCSSPQCGLFLGSSESYGKSLLYLKDQVKDLERNMDRQKDKIKNLAALHSNLKKQIEENEKQLEVLDEQDEVNGLVDTIRELTESVFDLQKELKMVSKVEVYENDYVQHLNEREALQNELAELSRGSGQIDLRAMETRALLRDGVKKWLDVLDTKNVSRDISIDSDFTFTFGGEKVTQFKGSTLTRVILAFHSAVFEMYLSDPNRKFRFLILDTPRQQDIEADALAKYISELKLLAKNLNAQIVFSTTEFHYETVEGDIEWHPTFPGPEQNMYLGQSSLEE